MFARLSSETDLTGFRNEARVLLARQVPPDEVQWEARPDDAAASSIRPPSTADAPSLRSIPKAATALVPASFLRLCEVVVLHRDPCRFELLYRVLWRLVHEPALRHDPLDADMQLVQQMAQAVRRDLHRMKALLRFHEVPDDAGEPLIVAWFEPTHHIVEAVAPWFARRLPDQRWAILTPERCACWDGRQLLFGPGGRREQLPRLGTGDAAQPRSTTMDHPVITPRQGTRQPVTRDPASTQRAERIGSLEQLKAATMRCRECPIGAHATQSVNGEGRLHAAVMLVGEQPGDQEDLQGHPFVGPAGRLLERALEAIGVSRDAVFMSNAVKHFKFELRGKRRIHKSPTQREIAACRHWLEDEIALVRPRALVALGASAARSLLGRPVAVTAERGQWLRREDGLRVLVTLHPSALLRLQGEDRDAAFDAFVADLRKALA